IFGIAAWRQIYEGTRDVVTIVTEIQRAAGRCDSAGNRRVVYWPIKLQRNRSDQVGKIVSHYKRVSSFHAQRSKQCRTRQLNFRTFFDRLTASRVYQICEFDVFRVFSATQVDEPADYLLARRAADLNVSIECRTEILGERNRNGFTTKVDAKRR